jgi:hypothetical protein
MSISALRKSTFGGKFELYEFKGVLGLAMIKDVLTQQDLVSK